MKKFLIIVVAYSISAIAQIPSPAFNPMTSIGANGIHWSDHTLFWQNPSGVQYNECYFSTGCK
jgi:hypothetical protein